MGGPEGDGNMEHDAVVRSCLYAGAVRFGQGVGQGV